MSSEPREQYRPVFWWVLGALPGAIAGGAVGAAVFGWVLEPLFFSETDGLEDLGPLLIALFLVLGAGVVGGAIAGGTALMRWNRRRSMPSDPNRPAAPL